MILIGSRALAFYAGIRKPNDVDYVGTYDEAMQLRKEIGARVCYPINSGKSIFMQTPDKTIYEVEVAWEGSRAEKLVKFVESQPDNLVTPFGNIVPSLDVLYMLKLSHRYLKNSPHFLKTMEDIHLMRKIGAKIRPEHEEFYKERQKDTYVYNLPKLNQSKNDFFGAYTGVEYKYDHDSIHNAAAVLHKPAYTFFKPADSEVMVSKEMWDRLDEEIKLLAVYEEACVLALERSLVPYPGKKTPKEAFDMALMKVCTSITSGWFREYAWEHYYDVQRFIDSIGHGRFMKKFYDGLDSGVVKPFKQ